MPAAPADAARAALALLAEHPEHGSAVRALVEGPRPTRYDLPTTALVVTGVLLALKTHVRIERDAKDRYQVLVEQKATDAKLLRELVRKLLNLGADDAGRGMASRRAGERSRTSCCAGARGDAWMLCRAEGAPKGQALQSR